MSLDLLCHVALLHTLVTCAPPRLCTTNLLRFWTLRALVIPNPDVM